MEILVLTTLFPNKQMPNYAVFVKERIVNLAKLCNVKVIAPVPYFPRLKINKNWFLFSRIPLKEDIEGVRVYHPRYFITPKIFRSLYGIFMFLSIFIFIKRLKKEYNFDLIDAHFVYPDGLAAVLLGKMLNKKVIINARGTDINCYPKFRIIRKLIQYTLKNADVIISVSEDLKDKIVKLGISEEKINIITNGVDTNKFFSIAKYEARKILNLPQDKKIILSIGNLLKGKGFHILIEAVKYLQEEDVIILIIGEGPYRRELERLIKTYNCENKVKLLGEKPQKELYKWYSAADAFCLLSLSEGRPNVVLEALACGVPVVTMNKWGLSNIINEDRGILLDSYNPYIIAKALDRVLERVWDKKSMVSFMKNFSWQKTAKDTYDIFENILETNDIIFFSSDDWDSGLKTSKYHLSIRLAQKNRVLFINSLSLRTPNISKRDFKKVFGKLKNFFRGAVEVRKNLFVYTPVLIPSQKFGCIRFLNNLFIFLQIKMIMNRYNFSGPLIWTFIPNSLGIIKRLPRRGLIYYCVDNMSAFKGVPCNIIKSLDDKLTKEADIVFTVSNELFETKGNLNKKTFYSPHGVDFALFNQAITNIIVERPRELNNISNPIIGFYGLISSDWVDYDLVRYIAQNKSEWSFVFIGKIDKKPSESLPNNKNIHYLPIKPYAELYKYIKFFDVAILPFNINQLTIHSHPLKILEYLSAGKPVVAINIPELKRYSNLIEIASDKREFLEKIEYCLTHNNGRSLSKRVEFASKNSWEDRFNEIQEIIYTNINKVTI